MERRTFLKALGLGSALIPVIAKAVAKPKSFEAKDISLTINGEKIEGFVQDSLIVIPRKETIEVLLKEAYYPYGTDIKIIEMEVSNNEPPFLINDYVYVNPENGKATHNINEHKIGACLKSNKIPS